MSLTDTVRSAGVVGAGGAGFPTHVKVDAQAEWVLANGAECEPLLHKDRELMVHFADQIVAGLELVQNSVGAKYTAVGLKRKNTAALKAIQNAVSGYDTKVTEFDDYYPAGDEYELVYGITGRLVPPAGIPLQVGAVVNNVETLYNVSKADKGEPVVDTFLTVAGYVKEPVTVKVPVGMRFSDVLQLAGGPIISKYAIFVSGLMMGTLAECEKQPVTKTTAGLIVLPADHLLVVRRKQPEINMNRIGRSACDQCSYCTELCPRYLLGYEIEPHKVMRALVFSMAGAEEWNKYGQLCCGCGICTLYACPELLFPKEACDQAKADFQKKDIQWKPPGVHPMKDARRVPLSLLMKRMGVADLDAPAHWKDVHAAPDSVELLLKQHTGAPAVPVVSEGDTVSRGQLLAEIPEKQLGAFIHASISGRVKHITEQSILIERM